MRLYKINQIEKKQSKQGKKNKQGKQKQNMDTGINRGLRGKAWGKLT
jgi:hypothetical protein